MATQKANHWEGHAQQWALVGPPLRPDKKDISLVESFLNKAAQQNKERRAVLLGVTPELALLKWSNYSSLIALDLSMGMLKAVWPSDKLDIPAIALQANWLSMPFESQSASIVIGDGCYTLMPSNKNYDALSTEIRRILKPDGYFLIRFFLRPEIREKTETIFDDLLSGRIGNFNIFKWRLAMSLHGTLEEGVILDKVWTSWHDSGIDPNILANQLGWPTAVINTINVYRNVETRYTFPTLNEIRQHLGKYFTEEEFHQPDYELGERCPTFFLKPK